MIGDIAIAFMLAVITAFVLTPYTIRFAKYVGAVDIPNDRRVNKKPMPRLGGIGVICGFLLSTAFLVVTTATEGKIDFFADNLYIKLIGFLCGIILLAIVTLIDDIKGIKPIVKLLGQLVAAIIVTRCGILIDSFNIFGNNEVANEIFANILTIGWIVGITNAINLIDGLDGLSSGISLISCASLIVIFVMNPETSPLISIVLAAALSGGIAGFLPYNIHPAKTFIGDIGSNFMGFSIAVISILGVAKTYTAIVLFAPLIILGIPIVDTLWAIIRRIVKNKSLKGVFMPDKGHIHHKLMARGYTQKQSVLILYAAAVALGMSAIILLDSGIWKTIGFIAIIILMVAIYVVEKRVQNEERRKELEERKVEVKKEIKNKKK